MKNQVLNIEEMQELINIGIDVSKASMCWIGCSDGNDVYPYNLTFKDIFKNHKETIPMVITPTFTLQDMLEMLPKKFTEKTDIDFWESWYILTITHLNSIWRITYWNDGWGDFKNKWFESDSLLEAAFKMLKWCKENNYI